MTMRKIFILMAALAFSAATAAAAEDPEIVVREPTQAWISRHAAPLYIDIRSRRGGRLRVEMDFRAQAEYAVTREVDMPPESSLRLEFSVPVGASGRIRCLTGGRVVEKTVGTPSFNTYFLGGDKRPPLVSINGFLYRDLEGLRNSMTGGDELVVHTLGMDELPARWQSYAGFMGVLLLEAREARTLGPERREALARWVRWLGGRVWLAGPGADDAARELGFDDAVAESRDGIARRSVANGQVWTQSAPDADRLLNRLPAVQPNDPLAGYYWEGNGYAYNRPDPGGWLLYSLAGASTNLIVVALIVLGAVMGPLNYLYIRRRKNPLLFFVTTPLIAIAGTGVVFAASFLAEGGAGGYNQCAVLIRAGTGGDAMLFDGKGVRSGFYPASPRLSAETLVLPVGRAAEDAKYSVEIGDGVRLAGGWLRPRFATGYLAATPVVSRMNIDVEERGGEYYAVNGLGFEVESLVVRLPGGWYGLAENIQPGVEARLSRGKDDMRVGALESMARHLFGGGDAFPRIDLIARCSGLPYLEDGGLGASRLSGEYYYCRLSSDGPGGGK